uniref:NADH dehydrogenase subunit 2 n=1 Tax=Amblyomma albolimbatum TaxID=1987572 RepID=UPI0030FEB68D
MFFKILMKWMILITILISISCNSWFIYWLMMEMNLLFFIPFLNKKKMTDSNSMITYFVIQSFSSTIFMMSALMFVFVNTMKMLIIISMMIKLAIIPFHFWMISISEMLNFDSLFLILSFQKFIPMYILSKFNHPYLKVFALISSIMSSMLALNSKMIKKMLIFSSISHQGWMIMLFLMKSKFWFLYLMVYTFLIFKITKLMKMLKFNSISNFSNSNMNSWNKISLITMMMSLGGMPPFMGFFLKIISIFIFLNNFNFSIIILIISSMINIFFYLNLIQPYFIINLIKFKITSFKMILKNFFLNLNMFLILFLLNLMIF